MMKLPLDTEPTAFPVGAADISIAALDVPAAALHRLSLLLSEDELQRAGRYAFERDWRRFVVARGRLRQLLADKLGVRPEAIAFMFGRHGKPALAPPFSESGLHFNVAHSGELAVYAFSRDGEVGVDVEALRAVADADDIVVRFFSPIEREAYRALRSCHKRMGFFNCWTRKEAFLKALGDGLHYPLDAFEVSLAPGEPARILRVAETPGEDCGWCLESFIPAPGYVGALVTRTANTAAPAVRAVWSARALP
jgi:4'-phosphopantetheinyl transferase